MYYSVFHSVRVVILPLITGLLTKDSYPQKNVHYDQRGLRSHNEKLRTSPTGAKQIPTHQYNSTPTVTFIRETVKMYHIPLIIFYNNIICPLGVGVRFNQKCKYSVCECTSICRLYST